MSRRWRYPRIRHGRFTEAPWAAIAPQPPALPLRPVRARPRIVPMVRRGRIAWVPRSSVLAPPFAPLVLRRPDGAIPWQRVYRRGGAHSRAGAAARSDGRLAIHALAPGAIRRAGVAADCPAGAAATTSGDSCGGPAGGPSPRRGGQPAVASAGACVAAAVDAFVHHRRSAAPVPESAGSLHHLPVTQSGTGRDASPPKRVAAGAAGSARRAAVATSGPAATAPLGACRTARPGGTARAPSARAHLAGMDASDRDAGAGVVGGRDVGPRPGGIHGRRGEPERSGDDGLDATWS